MAKRPEAKRPKAAPLIHGDAPTFYADQPAGMAFSPQVTKITFGVDDNDSTNEFPRPVVTIVLPTDAVLNMVRDMVDILGSEEFKAEMLDKTAKLTEIFTEGVSAGRPENLSTSPTKQTRRAPQGALLARTFATRHGSALFPRCSDQLGRVDGLGSRC